MFSKLRDRNPCRALFRVCDDAKCEWVYLINVVSLRRRHLNKLKTEKFRRRREFHFVNVRHVEAKRKCENICRMCVCACVYVSIVVICAELEHKWKSLRLAIRRDAMLCVSFSGSRAFAHSHTFAGFSVQFNYKPAAMLWKVICSANCAIKLLNQASIHSKFS